QPNQPDAAQRLANYLRQAGYTQVFLVDSWPQLLKTTRIIAPQGDHQGAAKVRADLGLGEVLIDSNGYLISDVTVQMGQDWIERAKGLAQ
ncbi:MAG: LytR C-terminal domain-containing protein, partial [Microcystaceae cyanobacterium]